LRNLILQVVQKCAESLTDISCADGVVDVVRWKGFWSRATMKLVAGGAPFFLLQLSNAVIDFTES
jgi:hypothetical protein